MSRDIFRQDFNFFEVSKHKVRSDNCEEEITELSETALVPFSCNFERDIFPLRGFNLGPIMMERFMLGKKLREMKYKTFCYNA